MSELAGTRNHDHYPLRSNTYKHGRTQSDQACRKNNCDGIARVQSAWAPDTGMNWLRCCCCGDEWNPGKAIYPPGVGEMLNGL